MYHALPRTARFWSVLLAIDHDLAETTRKNSCPCGGRLHASNYLRKPRGTPQQLPRPQCVRLSFCCDRDGCRKRVTPPSVRFLGPKVYLGVIVILISAARDRVQLRAESESFPSDSGATSRPSPAGRHSRGDHFPKRHSGRRNAHAWCRLSRSSPFRFRCWMPSSSAITAAGAGRCSCDFSHGSRSPAACKSRSRSDRFPPAKDALRDRRQPVYTGCHSSFT